MTKSEMLLGRLIEERLSGKADVAEIDQRIRALFEEEWCVVVTDVAGFSRQASDAGVIPGLCLMYELRRMARPIIEASGGHVIKTLADSYLIMFRRPADGLRSMLQLQQSLGRYNDGRPSEQQLNIRVGLGFGKVLKVDDENVFGVEVIFAAKLGVEVARPGEIVVSGSAREALASFPGVSFEERGGDGLDHIRPFAVRSSH